MTIKKEKKKSCYSLFSCCEHFFMAQVSVLVPYYNCQENSYCVDRRNVFYTDGDFGSPFLFIGKYTKFKWHVNWEVLIC